MIGQLLLPEMRPESNGIFLYGHLFSLTLYLRPRNSDKRGLTLSFCASNSFLWIFSIFSNLSCVCFKSDSILERLMSFSWSSVSRLLFLDSNCRAVFSRFFRSYRNCQKKDSLREYLAFKQQQNAADDTCNYSKVSIVLNSVEHCGKFFLITRPDRTLSTSP